MNPWLLGLCVLIPLGLLAASPGTPAQEIPPVTYSGTVEGWSVDELGTVSLRLVGEKDGRPFKIWFSTAANQTGSTNFEELVLEAILELSRHGTKKTRVTVTGEVDDGREGNTLKNGITLIRIQK